MIARSASQRFSRNGSARVSSSGISRVAPAHRYGQSSHTEASNPGLASRVARASGVTWYSRQCQETRLTSPRWATATPFGVPVEPDV